ncbi:Uncharacterised protein [Dermatophilus congolensis]|uniref:Phytase-like domain-containing protein n=2 Tax=Dermatophilus congolensis TaxID=1863 RepID=A0A239VU57_9MICO|nr:Uncharacterised protein [Dermatophilus congolensis]
MFGKDRSRQVGIAMSVMVAACMGAGLPAPASAAGPAAPTLADCGGQAVFVDSSGRVNTYDVAGEDAGAKVTLRGSDGKLSHRPAAFTFAAEAGDIAAGVRVHFAVTPSGRMQRILVTTASEHGYRAKMQVKTIGRGFAPTALAAQVDPLEDNAGFVYTADKNGVIRRYSYSDVKGLGGEEVVANKAGAITDLSFGRYVEQPGKDGTTTTVADVLTAMNSATGDLSEITVPYASGKATTNVLKTGFAGYQSVRRLQCPEDKGGFIAFDRSGSATVFADENIHDGLGTDIRRVGQASGRIKA